MNFLTADVAIKVDDSKLPQQLAKARSAVTKTVDKIKSSFAKMATSFKAAWDKIVRYAKWGALALAGALTLAARAAMKQEDAQFLLAAALKISGEWTQKLENRLKVFASGIQQATIYGDELILSLMQQQKSLGVSADKLEEAAKMAVGLATATGKDISTMAMYTAMAMQGEFTLLRRYIPALRATTDRTEQLAILTKFAADGFKLAEERAKTASGALRQMWNALGDVAEVIGAALLPGVKDTAKEIKKWAEDNQQRIARWAKVSVTYITYVKDMLVSLVQFMWTDWKAGFQYAKDISVAIFKDMATEIKKVFADLIKDLEESLTGWWSRKTREFFGAEGMTSEQAKRFQELAFGKAPAPRLRKPTEQELMGILPEWQRPTALSQIVAPSELQTKFDVAGEKLKATLEGIGTTAEDTGMSLTEMAEQWMAVVEETTNEIIGLTEEQKNAVIKAAQDQVTFVREQDYMTREMRIQNLEAYVEANQEALDKVKEANQILADEIQRLEGAKMTGTKRWLTEASDFWQQFDKVVVNMLDGMADAMTTALLKGEDVWKSFAQTVIFELTRMIIKMQMYQALMWAFGFGAPAPSGEFPTTSHGVPYIPAGQGPGGLQHGGTVLETGWAKVHKGETYSGVGGKPTRIEIHNEGSEKLEVSEAEIYAFSDERILHVTMRAMESDGPYRRSIRNARG